MSKSRSRQYAETLLRSFDLAYQFRFVSGLPSCSDHSKGCRSDLWKKMGLLKSPSLHIRNRGNTVSSLQAVSRMKVCPGVSSNNWDFFFLGGGFYRSLGRCLRNGMSRASPRRGAQAAAFLPVDRDTILGERVVWSASEVPPSRDVSRIWFVWRSPDSLFLLSSSFLFQTHPFVLA